MKKMNVVIFGNCQCPAVGRTLLESKKFTEAYEWIVTPPVQNIKNADQIAHLIESVSSADVFIYQRVNNPSWPKEISSPYLLSILSSDALKISIPSLYFDGYFPHLSTMEGVVGPLNLVHDYFIAGGYVNEMTPGQVKEMILSDGLYDADLSNDLVECSILELANREKMLDVKVSGYIEENFRKRKLFNQFNHPRREVFEYVCCRILDELNFPEKGFSSEKLGYLDAVSTPIYPSSIKSLGLEFMDDEVYRGVGGYKTLDEVIHGFYQVYDELNNDFIIENIKLKKPFSLKLIGDYLLSKN